MIVDAKLPGATWALGKYIEHKLRRAFRGIWLSGALPDEPGGLLAYANHSSFWDGFVAWLVNNRAGRDGYLVMEEHMLARYRFFARGGAFSIRRNDRGSALQTLRYAAKVLARPKSTVFVFPQGRIVANALPPLRFERGVEVLARMAKVRCVPVAFRFAFLEHEYPDVMIRVGESHLPEPVASMEQRLGALVTQLSLTQEPPAQPALLQGRKSVAQRWDTVRGLT